MSVVIATRGYSDDLRAAISSLRRTMVSEIVVISKAGIDAALIGSDNRVKLFFAPELSLSQARNLGIAHSTSEFVAFTDDDCTVPEDWPLRALEMFGDTEVAVVGGPGITDSEDDAMSKCAGAVLSSHLGTLSSVYRYAAMSDLPRAAGEKHLSTCNLFFRKNVLQQAGYFESKLEACEENELIERIRSAGYKVLYVPSCVVSHRRRPLFRAFLRQIWRYGNGRAKFTVTWPKHLRPVCLAPALLVCFTLTLIMTALFSLLLAEALAVILMIYFLVIALAAVESTTRNHLKLRFAPLVFLGISAMHYCYGLSFLAGLCIKFDGKEKPS